MKKSDIGLCAAIYGILIFFFVQVMGYKPEVRIYPLFVMTVLFILNTAYLLKSVVAYIHDKKIENDYISIFKEFQPRQYAAILLFSLIYVVLICLIGFYPSTLLYLVGTLLFLKVRIPYIAITVVVFACIIYGAFSKFLHVPLPSGILF